MARTITTEPTIVQVRYRSEVDAWWATETTADCRRFICQRGAWPTLADAIPALRKMKDRGEDLRIQASREQIAVAVRFATGSGPAV